MDSSWDTHIAPTTEHISDVKTPAVSQSAMAQQNPTNGGWAVNPQIFGGSVNGPIVKLSTPCSIIFLYIL